MRKRRAIIYDDEPALLELLTIFFEDLGYEVVANKEPVACPALKEGTGCSDRRPCSDIMVTDLVMPGMSGLEMLALQARRGCGIDIRNKAVHSGSLGPGSLDAIRQLGCGFFHKPAPLIELRAWVRECESRMDLSLPLGVPGRESGEATCAETGSALWPDAVESFVEK